MANNRTEFKTQVLNLIKAIVNIAKHRQTLNDELADSINFRKDVKGSTITATASANNIDFTSNDLVTIDGATNNLDLVLTITNTEDGEDSKYIRVTKDSGKTVTFSGATDITYGKSLVLYGSDIVYQVINKNGTIFVNALVDSDPNSESSLLVDIQELGDWDMDTNANPVVTPVNPSGDKDKIRHVQVMIRHDVGAAITSNLLLNTVDSNTGVASGGIGLTTDSVILIFRVPGGQFDNTDHDSTSFNRGWITVWYEPS